jgi:phosphoenolpyruvate carboxylase
MASLDIRQNALVHQQVIGEALGEKDWLERSSEDRIKRLKMALENFESPLEPLSSDARRTLAVFQAIAHCRRKYGARSIGSYVVSMAKGPDDVLSVLLLAKWGDLAPKGGAIPLDITPLFETVEDLKNASMIMGRLLKDDIYKKHLESRSGHQTVMVGYSDSNKDGGLASARWTLQKTQAELVRTLNMNGIKLTLFHGRGGTVSRGGGRVHEAVNASPPGAIAGRLRVTEQGEMVNAKFGLRAIALRTLERTVSSVLWVSASNRVPHPKEPHWASVMETIASVSHEAYQKTIYDSADFSRYFREVTPIDVIERLDIGSRPVSRAEDGEIRSLRAIPWVFAWTQSRFLLPGWFGIGAGLEEARNQHGDAVLKEMFDAWDFFKVLLCDVEVVLSKADINIAERYSELAGKLHRQYFPMIRDEYDRSINLVLQIREQSKLLENDETLRRSIRLRNPYVDPMSLLQIDLLKSWRLAGREDDATLKALKASVHGIAYGMQNTG